MGSGAKIGLGFLGFCIGGALASQFADPVPLEKDLKFGQRFFRNQCQSQTRNRKINGKWGRGYKYCECVSENLDMLLKTGEAYRYAEAMHSTSSAERWLLEKTRIKSATESTRTKFSPVSRKRSRLCDRSVLPRDHHWLRSPDVNGREKLRLIWLMSMVFGVVMVLKGIGMML